MSLPGAGPPNSDERLAAALKSQSVNTGRGAVQTRSATRRPPTEPYHAPAAGSTGSPLVAYAAFSNAAVGVALGDTITMDPTPFESSGDWASYFDASSGDVALLADGLYAFDAYVHSGHSFATDGGLGVVSFGIGSGSSIRRGVAVVSGGQIWGSVHSQPALWSNGDAWHMSTASVVNASDGSGATVWCQVYYYGPVV